MQLPSGVLADSVGPRRLVTAGLLVAGIGSLIFARAPDVAWLLAGRALVGLGVAVAFVSVLKLIASWFSEREFGTWVGVLQLIGNFGGMLGAYPLAWATQYVSWRDVFLGAGVLSLCLALAIWFWARDTPREAGLPALHGREGDSQAQVARIGWAQGLARVAANHHSWAAFAMHFGQVGSYLTFSGLWAVPYLTDGLGLTRASATLHVTAMILGFAFGSPMVGALSDRMGVRLPLLRASSLLYLASWLPWVMGWSMPAALSLAAFALMGVGVSGVVLIYALTKELNPPALSGTATSFVNTGGFMGVALLQPTVGWMLDLSAAAPALDSYRSAAMLLALVALIGVVAAFRMPETRCRNVYKERE